MDTTTEILAPVGTLREHLADYLEAVRNGATIIITKHGTPVAELRPTTAEMVLRRS